jgi:hypothetical protein
MYVPEVCRHFMKDSNPNQDHSAADLAVVSCIITRNQQNSVYLETLFLVQTLQSPL